MADSAPAGPFAVRFNRAFDIATVVAVALWQVVAVGTAVLAYYDQYRSPASVVAIWGAQLLIIVCGAALLLRRKESTAITWSLVAVDLATGVAMAVNCPGEHQLRINWGWTSVGLIGVLLVLHRPVREVVSLLAVNAGIVFVALTAEGEMDRHTVAGFITLLYASASIQLALIAGARVFRFSGGMAAEAAAERWEMATREAVIAEVAAARQDRYREVRRLITGVLRGLADGTVDPADPAVRHRCATAEAMLRQLLAERDDVPNPLLRLLRTGIDETMRRGTVIDLAQVGEMPPMSEEVAAAIAEVPLAVLTGARENARVTVVSATPGHVSVSVLVDGDALVPETTVADGVTVTSDRDGDLLWVEAGWNEP
ncbi:hypothetical protein [Actinomadura rudentiformis]|uniref:Histidine kinase n=1 Tax=Actinomadura rudentiformis TaxID=359158 RepID=A0A6H9ZAJ8_9ACTN|nr:hypothetical protein [Actinomadura rudentiformis]KAB2352503.1 hypothetical protein F8566_02145 [Actinomadura rudentiformis]